MKSKQRDVQDKRLKQKDQSKSSHKSQKDEKVPIQIIPPSKMKFRLEPQSSQSHQSQGKRFKINLRQISESHKNKLSHRFHEIDRQFVCRKTKEQRAEMGIEYQTIKLIDIYTKSNPNKVIQKYGKSLNIELLFNEEGEPTLLRKVLLNKDFVLVENQEDELEEERQLDEQKLFQTLHEQLLQLQKKYNKSTEQISELFLRVCGDLDMVEQALMGKQVPEWTYLEDLALTKSYETTEYQWLLKQKGQKEIDKRRRFLLTAEGDPNEGVDVEMKEEEDPLDESVGYV